LVGSAIGAPSAGSGLSMEDGASFNQVVGSSFLRLVNGAAIDASSSENHVSSNLFDPAGNTWAALQTAVQRNTIADNVFNELLAQPGAADPSALFIHTIDEESGQIVEESAVSLGK
jgi:hypothetical protein